MYRFVLMILLASLTETLFAQLAEPLTFQEKIHDFGNILEKDGSVSFDFIVSNKSIRPVRIIKVLPSCGCTTPDWTKDPIAVGGTGFIKASFNPLGRPGYFDKTLTITTDWDVKPMVVHIKGNVVDPEKENDPASFTVESGSLKLKSGSFNIGKIFINKEPETFSFPVLNAGKDSVHFTGSVSPRYIKVETPKALGAGQIGNVKLTFNGPLKGQYGFTSENIELKTDDELLPNKSFSVYATVEEFFPKLSADDLAKAPVLTLSANAINFGNVKAGAVLEREIKFTNNGKSELIVRHAQSNCSCLSITPAGRRLKPGQEIPVKVSLNTAGRSGPQNKSITIYSNDPQNPVQRITFSVGVR
ncbi:MAG: DUF1573 domain-containing protein [Bacteroidetes bacterium]|nr:DUF1573 domain-containing protein [Bacteroidota bacterium]